MTVVKALSVGEVGHPPDVPGAFPSIVSGLAEARPVANGIDAPAGVGQKQVGQPKGEQSPPFPKGPYADDLGHENEGHHQRDIQPAHQSFLHEIAAHFSPSGRVASHEPKHVVDQYEALLAEAAQGKEYAWDGMMGVDEPPGMASPKSVHGCVGVVFCIRASMMIAMKTHPQKR